MDNKVFNDQKERYAHKKGGKEEQNALKGNDEGLADENIWLNLKIEELQ